MTEGQPQGDLFANKPQTEQGEQTTSQHYPVGQWRKRLSIEDLKGIAETEIQAEIAERQTYIASERPKLQEKYPDDDLYFTLKKERMRGEQIGAKLTEPEDKAWVAERVREIQKRQESTSRGKILKGLEEANAELTKFQQLKQFIPQPTQTRA